MSDPDDLATIRRVEAAMRAVLDLRLESVGTSEPDQTRSLVAAAHALWGRAGSPLRVLLAGEWSAGKSSLLGALVDDPELLPVSGAPTTSLPTSILLTRSGEPRTRVVGRAVSFLSRTGVDELARFLRDELTVELASTVVVPPGSIATLDPLADWTTFAERMRPLWEGDRDEVAAKKIVRELAAMRDALDRQDGLLPAQDPGPPLDVAAGPWREALTIGRRRDTPREFPEPTVGRPVTTPAMADAEQLAALQPLMARAVVRVELPDALWTFGALDAVELVDLPGRGADGGRRDAYVVSRELHRATAMIVVLTPDALETDDKEHLVRDLSVGRRAPLNRLDSSAFVVVNKLNTGPTPGADVIAQEEFLRRCLRAADDTVPGTVPSFVSSWAYWQSRGRAEVLGVTDAQLKALAENRTAWRAVADSGRLPDLAWLLRAYDADGGVVGLRRRLGEHLRREGTAVEAAELTARAVDVRRALERWAASAPVAPPPPAGPGARRELERLRADLLRVLTRLRAEAERLAVSGEFDPGAPAVPVHLRRVAGKTVLTDDSAQWALLLGETGEDGLIPEPRPGSGLPTSTDGFRPAHEAMLADLDAEIDQQLDKQCHAWQQRWRDETTALADRFAASDLPERLAAWWGAPDGVPPGRRIEDVLRLEVGTEVLAQARAARRLTPRARDLFPLSRDDRGLGWGRDSPPERRERRENAHVTRALRLRSLLVDAAADAAAAHWNAAVAVVADRLDADVTRARALVPAVSGLRRMAAAESGTAGERGPGPAELVARVITEYGDVWGTTNGGHRG